MSILKIARIGNPILFKKAKLIDKIKADELKRLILDMSETLIDANGIGLAAPQVHIGKRIIIYRVPVGEEKNNEKKIGINVLINPSYKKDGDETNDDWEGCLSIPGMLGKVRRFKKIIFQGFGINGKIIKKKVEGLHARVIQHECDHLEGILYTSKLVDKKYFGFLDEVQRYLKDENE